MGQYSDYYAYEEQKRLCIEKKYVAETLERLHKWRKYSAEDPFIPHSIVKPYLDEAEKALKARLYDLSDY